MQDSSHAVRACIHACRLILDCFDELQTYITSFPSNNFVSLKAYQTGSGQKQELPPHINAGREL